jgi:signal transduction histidine kinase
MKRLLRSFSFRLAAIYSILFTLSLAVLLGTYHFVSIAGPKDEVKDALRAEYRALAAGYSNDPPALAAALEKRAGEASPRAGFHLLSDPSGRVITTNLPSWPEYSGPRWLSIEADIYRDGDEDDHEALAIDRRQPDGSRLLIGRDVEELDDLEEAIGSAARYLLLATVFLAILGALLMNRAIGRRIEAVSGAAREVMAGDLSRRIAVTGSGDDFDRLATTLNLMLEQVEEGVAAVRRVSDSVAHELRTPLTRLQASLREMDSEGAAGPALAAAIEEAERLQIIFDAVLRIARIESGRHAGVFQQVDLSMLLADAADLYGPEAEARGVGLISDPGSDLFVSGDPDLLFQAVSNLIDNAIKFTPANGKIAISGRGKAGSVVVEIRDSGPGIPNEMKDRVKERFFRAPGSLALPGFGLGLSVVEAVAQMHASSIEFSDAYPGTIVTWILPSADRDAA